MLVSSSVWPSGCAFATAAVPMLVEAPGRLMMTKRWRIVSLSRSASTRAIRSVPPPAANGTTISTVRLG